MNSLGSKAKKTSVNKLKEIKGDIISMNAIKIKEGKAEPK